MRTLRSLIAFTLIGLTGCAASSSHTQIESIKSQDAIPTIHKMYLLVDMGQGLMTVINSVNLIDKDFNDTFIGQARACDVQASSIFDQRWKIIRAANMNPSNADENNIRKLDHEAMETLHPDAIFYIKYDSYTTTTQMAASRVSRFTYHAVLTDYNSQKELWKGGVDLSPAASWDQSKPDASPSAIMAHDLIRKMAADGILKNCPPEIPAH